MTMESTTLTQTSPFMPIEQMNKDQLSFEDFMNGFFKHPETEIDEQLSLFNVNLKDNFDLVEKNSDVEKNKYADFGESLRRVYDEITYSSDSSDMKRENANINADTPMGKMLKIGTESEKKYVNNYVLPKRFADAHANGDIHIHDLDFYATGTLTCCQIDIDALFERGFSTGHGFLRTPNDIQSYAALACIAIQSNQNDQHGGQSIPNYDYALAKGVAKTFIKEYKLAMFSAVELLNRNLSLENYEQIKPAVEQVISHAEGVTHSKPRLTMSQDYLAEEKKGLLNLGFDEDEAKHIQDYSYRTAYRETEKKTRQSQQALIHNLCTMQSRAGSQTPFSSICFGTCTSEEGRMVIRSLLLATQEGLGRGETAIFPVQVFKVKEGVNYNPEDPNYDLFRLAMETSAQRLFPNFVFIDAPHNIQYYTEGHPETEVTAMGCRTRVMGNVYDPNNEIAYSRGNLSFTSLNLPRLAIESHGDLDLFFKKLEDMMGLCCDQLDERLRLQMSMHVYNFPMLMGQGVWLGSDKLKSTDQLGEVLLHGSLSVGFIGLAETLKMLTGSHHGENPDSQALGLKIIGFMRSYLDRRAQERKRNYTLLATPAEGLSGRFVGMDRKRYGVIPGVTDREYYTNSFHVPVYYNITAYDKIMLEAPYHSLCNAGHISYVELDGEPFKNMDAFESIIRCMHDAGIGYGSINFPLDNDPVCGYRGVIKEGNRCPRCGRDDQEPIDADGTKVKFTRIRRVTGYLSGDYESRFNSFKQAEVRDRVKHGLDTIQ